MSTAKLDEVKQDLAECEQFLSASKRPRIEAILTKERDELKKEVLKLEKKAASSTSNGTNEQTPGYQENITNYAWDQSDKFLKLYLSLDNLGAITEQNIKTDYTNRSVTVKIQFPNKTSQLHIPRLCEEIVAKDCYCKKKSEYVLVMLKKSETGKTWPWVTEREKKSKEKDKPKMDDNADPSAGITSLLKNMYDDGDDEMKRQISKAFYESQMKQAQGENPYPGL